jgi:4-hydroxybenzoyl-CoA thioesterase
LISLLHDARARFFRAMGLEELDAGGCGVILADLAVTYRSEAFFGQTLRVEMAAAEPERAGCVLFYRVTDRETGREVARARTGLVFFDYAARRVARTPAPFVAGLARLRGGAEGGEG